MEAEGRLALIAGSAITVDDLAPQGVDRTVARDSGGVLARETEHVVVIGRHGPQQSRPAHLVDHAANVRALAELGCDRVLALASTGSLRIDWPVGTVVAPNDFFGPWVTPSLFDDTRGHTVPGFDVPWRSVVVDAWRRATKTPLVDGGVYVHARGPRFETPAEIRFFATVGDLVGMTLGAECILAREAGLAYAALCVVDNLANGLGATALTTAEFETGVAANRERLVGDVRRVVDRLEESS
jgi:5'-methylthioadenosine phosphorylase